MTITLDRLQTYIRSSLVLGLLVIGGCTPKIQVHGKYIAPEQISLIKIGTHHKPDVEEILGLPLSTSAFNDNVWYYGGRKTSKTSFQNPVLIDYKGYAVYFNNKGQVSKIEKTTQNDIVSIDPAKRYTATAGHEMTMLEQMSSYARRPAGKDMKGPRP